MNKTHFIYIPVVGVGINKRFSDEWLSYRISIFRNFTLKSLLNQTNKNFIVWFGFTKAEETNPIVLNFCKFLATLPIETICSYSGLIYIDDRNLESNTTLPERLSQALLPLKAVDYEFGDYIYLTRIDSDDMFHKDVVELIQQQEPNVKALSLRLGYVYNKDTDQLADWNPLTQPPFHTIIFPKEVFFDAEKNLAWYENFTSHEDIARLSHRVLWRGENRLDRLYMVLTHSPQNQISTTWQHPFRGKEIIENKAEILANFGLL